MTADPSASPTSSAESSDPPPGEPLVDEPFVHASRPPNTGESKLVTLYYERYAGQSARMDELGRQMITVEMAVPGLYASILALLRGDQAVLPGGPWAVPWLYVTFGGWGLALLLTFLALFPRDYTVDTDILRADPAATDGVLGIEDYFRRPAVYKWWLLGAAMVAFGVGIVGAVVVVFGPT